MKYVLNGEMLLSDIYSNSILRKLITTYKQIDGIEKLIDELNFLKLNDDNTFILANVIRDLANDTTQESFISVLLTNKHNIMFRVEGSRQEIYLFLHLINHMVYNNFRASFLDNDIEKHSNTLNDMINYVEGVNSSMVIYGTLIVYIDKVDGSIYEILKRTTTSPLVEILLDSNEHHSFITTYDMTARTNTYNIVINTDVIKNPEEDIQALLDVLPIGSINTSTITIATKDSIETISGCDNRIRKELASRLEKTLVDKLVNDVKRVLKPSEYSGNIDALKIAFEETINKEKLNA